MEWVRGQMPGLDESRRLFHSGDLAEVRHEGLLAALLLAPVVVHVRRVIAVLGQAQSDELDGRLGVLLHGDNGSVRAVPAFRRPKTFLGSCFGTRRMLTLA